MAKAVQRFERHYKNDSSTHSSWRVKGTPFLIYKWRAGNSVYPKRYRDWMIQALPLKGMSTEDLNALDRYLISLGLDDAQFPTRRAAYEALELALDQMPQVEFWD